MNVPDRETLFFILLTSAITLRSFVRYLLRRRGVTVGRHSFGARDVLRSAYLSLTQSRRSNYALVILFITGLFFRQYLRRVVDALLGRRPDKYLRFWRRLFNRMARNLWLWMSA